MEVTSKYTFYFFALPASLAVEVSTDKVMALSAYAQRESSERAAERGAIAPKKTMSTAVLIISQSVQLVWALKSLLFKDLVSVVQ